MSDALAELLEVSGSDEIAEIGGAHNQKGVNFQRYWAVTRMVELEQQGAADFLLLFEAIQDVAVLDSETSPSSICVYQVKKKDRKEWTWPDLTSLHNPEASKVKPLKSVQGSPLGKLYRAIRALKALKSSGHFASNAGCNITLFDGSSAATSVQCALSGVSATHLNLLSAALETLHESGEDKPDLSRLFVERVHIPPDDPIPYTVGVVLTFLKKRSPSHAGQASSLVDALIGQIGALGGRTEKCSSFEEMRRRKGYSRAQFAEALGQLEGVVDVASHLETWYAQLQHEGTGFMDIAAIRIAVSSIYRRQVMGARLAEEQRIVDECDKWLVLQPNPTSLKTFFETAQGHLEKEFPAVRTHELLAHFAIRAVLKCAGQTSED